MAAAPVRHWWRSARPRRRDLRPDTLAGLTGAVTNVPDGMATSVLAGVNPVYGLYASFAGTGAGGMVASTRLMIIGTTGASALAAGSAIEHLDGEDRADALFLLVIVAGVAMALAGLAGLGRYTRFVSHSVMTGFLTGIAVNIVASQIPDLTGAEASGSLALARAADVIVHPSRIEPASLAAGAGALALVVVAARSRRLATLGALVALAVPTVIVLLTSADVARVDDVGDIPGGVPLPALPDLGLLSPGLIAGALSVAAIVLVQGTGVSAAAPNPGGERSDVDRDFVAQGAGNLASGFWQGLPVGGSVGQTAVNVAAGARSRWAAVLSGVWMLVILVAFSGIVGTVAMPTLAAVLIYAAVGSVRPGELATIWRTGLTSQVAVAITLVATLLLPVTAAVGIGVALSLLLQLNQEAMDLAVVRLVRSDGDGWREEPAPQALPSDEVTVLDVYGSLLYAGARTLEARLPDATHARRPVVVLRLRGRTTLGATFFLVVADYAADLHRAGGRLYLSGVDAGLAEQLARTGRVDVEGPVQVVPASPTLGASTAAADEAARAWLVTHRTDPAPEADAGGTGGA